MTNTQRRRSAPVYLETERGTISLVFEADIADVAGNGVEIAGKPDVYVIDGEGVRLLRRPNPRLRALAIGLIAFVLLWAIFRLLRKSL